MSNESIIKILVVWSDTDGMWVATLPLEHVDVKFKSRHYLWAKAHALQWLVTEYYRIKVVAEISEE